MRGRGPLGRDHEAAIILHSLEEVRAGAKRSLAIVGESGVGKSTMLNWATTAARAAGFICAEARIPSRGGLPPLFPLAEVLKQFSAQNRIEHWLQAEPGVDTANNAPRETTDVLSLVKALEGFAAGGPLAIFIDDVHWAHSEGPLLLYSALRLAAARVLIVMTTRGGATMGPLPTASSDLGVEFMPLTGLDFAAVTKLVSQQLQGPVLPSLTRALFDRTLGNPLLVSELLRFWKDSEAVTTLSGGYWGLTQTHKIPESNSLLEMISGRLRSLDQNAFDCAAVLALLGRGGLPEELRTILELSFDEIVQALLHLERAGIAERDLSTSRYVLTHPLLQSALDQDLTETTKAALHTRIFKLMKERKRSSAAEIAYHGVRAFEPPEGLTACVREAALEAERMGTYAQAATWYSKLAESVDSSEELAQALVGRARAAEHFDPTLAVGIYSQAMDVFNQGSRVGLLIGRARAWRMAGKPLAALRDLEEAALGADENESLEIRDAAAVIHAVLGHSGMAATQFEALARETTGTHIHARVVGHLGTSAYFQGHIRKAIGLFRQALQCGADLQTTRYLEMNLGWLETLVGEWDEAEVRLAAGIDQARTANDLWVLIPLMTSATALAVWQGDLDKALDLGTQALRLTDETYLMDRLGAMGALGLALFERGLVGEAAELLASAPAFVEASSEKNEVQMSLLILGQCLLMLGDLRGAKSVIDQLASTLEFNLGWVGASKVLEGRYLLRAGRPLETIDLLKPLLTEPCEMAVQQAEICLVAAQALTQVGRHEEGQLAGAEAAAIYAKLGASHRREVAEFWLQKNHRGRRGRPKARVLSNLTGREVEILQRIVKGQANSEIATELFISLGTVKKHVENIRLKLGASRRSELITLGLDIFQAAAGHGGA